MDDQQYKKALEDDLKAYKKLEKINNSDEFNDFFDLLIDTAVKKMLQAFTEPGIKDWDEFCKLRGEVIAYIYPIQQVRGAEFLTSKIKENLNEYYNSKPQ